MLRFAGSGHLFRAAHERDLEGIIAKRTTVELLPQLTKERGGNKHHAPTATRSIGARTADRGPSAKSRTGCASKSSAVTEIDAPV